MARLRDPRIAIPLAIPAIALFLLVVAWGIDSALNSGSVTRNVTVAGVDVGGLDRDELDAALAEIAADYGDTEVQISTTGDTLTTTAGVVGIEVDTTATAEAVMDIGRGNLFTRPFRWVGSFFGEDAAPVAVQPADGDPEALLELINGGQPDPVEPTLTVTDGVVVVEPGRPALRFDVDEIQAEARAAAATGEVPITIEVGTTEVQPVTDDATAAAWADEVNAATEGPLRARAGRDEADLPAATIRSWLVFDHTEGEPTWQLDPDATVDSLAEIFPRTNTADIASDPEVQVVNGNLRIKGLAARVCCGPASADEISATLLAGDSEVRVPLIRSDEIEREILESVGIVELVSEATTPYDCCQSRVTNIQLFADLMTGVIIEPGESLSLNTFVGPRTIEKGFVESGVIERGELNTAVGGGISQFATTFFQASFYGGYQIDSYFPHTLWFSRYADFAGRRGIESTISFPQPDVQITNNTEYPLLIWPTYTDTSLTVSFYSTSSIEVDVAEQREFFSGQCTVIETDRERVFADGTREIDTFRARYQPADGIGCDGRPTNPDSVTPTPVPEPEPEPDRPNRPNRPNRPDPEPEPEPEPTAEPDPEPTAEPEPTTEPDPPAGSGGGGGDGGDGGGGGGGGGGAGADL